MFRKTGIPHQQVPGLKSLRTACGANMGHQLHSLQPFSPPPWAPTWLKAPEERFLLGLLPTPIHEWHPPGLPDGVQLFIKRDDLTGVQLSGNKVRKLEFLIADALRQKADTLVTIGGIQSNHCRATAVAARYAGFECHLVLRNNSQAAEQDPGLVGNLLVDRLVGAHIHQVTKEEYGKFGGVKLVTHIAKVLHSQGKRPYVVPLGGSNALGSWGYLQAAHELLEQLGKGAITDIVMACGSGGTTAGIALGNYLSGFGARVHAYGVCDDEEYFYNFIDGILTDMGATPDVLGKTSRDLLIAHQAKGAGYAMSRPEELQSILDVSDATGVILDPVYSGKAFHVFLKGMQANPGDWEGRKVLFLHTGGLLGMYSEAAELQAMLEKQGRAHRLDVTAISAGTQ
ncbi:g3580 [Coccomyxa elongata]